MVTIAGLIAVGTLTLYDIGLMSGDDIRERIEARELSPNAIPSIYQHAALNEPYMFVLGLRDSLLGEDQAIAEIISRTKPSKKQKRK